MARVGVVSLLLGGVLVHAMVPVMLDSFKTTYGQCSNDPGCAPIDEVECTFDGAQFRKTCKNKDGFEACKCNSQFVQPTQPNMPTADEKITVKKVGWTFLQVDWKFTKSDAESDAALAWTTVNSGGETLCSGQFSENSPRPKTLDCPAKSETLRFNKDGEYSLTVQRTASGEAEDLEDFSKPVTFWQRANPADNSVGSAAAEETGEESSYGGYGEGATGYDYAEEESSNSVPPVVVRSWTAGSPGKVVIDVDPYASDTDQLYWGVSINSQGGEMAEYAEDDVQAKGKVSETTGAQTAGTLSLGKTYYLYTYKAADGEEPEMPEAVKDSFKVPNPCGSLMQALKWNSKWSDTIDMTEKTPDNADYFDCTEAGGEWREGQGLESDYGAMFKGDKFCRVKYDFFDYPGAKPESIDALMCKNFCNGASDDDAASDPCRPMEPWPKCTCPDGDGPSADNWQACLEDGAVMCNTCEDPKKTPIALRKTSDLGSENSVPCLEHEPFHLHECGRDPTVGMRIVSGALAPPYSLEMCAFWTKKDPLCEGDYFYSNHHLKYTDYEEERWPAWKEMTEKSREDQGQPALTEEEWADEKRLFLKKLELDVFDGKKVSNFMIDKTKKYGCYCRASTTSNETKYITDILPIFETQNTTTVGWAGNTYKFDTPDNKTARVGEYMLTKNDQACPYPNYKLEGIVGTWKCPSAEPKPIFGWVLSPPSVTREEDGCIASPTTEYYGLMDFYAHILNLKNGEYHLLCYASHKADSVKGAVYRMFSSRMWSLMSGEAGRRLDHKQMTKLGISQPCGSTNFVYALKDRFHKGLFHEQYIIDSNNRTLFFVIRKWKFEDGRMTFLGEEEVGDNYQVTEDLRWKKCSQKWQVPTPLTQPEIDGARAANSKAAKAAFEMLGIDCKTDCARQFVGDMAITSSKNGLSYTKPEFWGMLAQEWGLDSAGMEAKCGAWNEVNGMDLKKDKCTDVSQAAGRRTLAIADKYSMNKSSKIIRWMFAGASIFALFF